MLKYCPSSIGGHAPPEETSAAKNAKHKQHRLWIDVLFLGKFLTILVSSEGKNIPGPNSGLRGISGPL